VIRAREDRWFDRFRRTGDPRLLAKVFDRTTAELWKVASHLCRDRHAAEDAVQGTFLVAIEAQQDWDATRPLLPWLLGLLVNRVREQRRRQRAPDEARVTPPAGERDPAELAGHGELGGAVRDALQRLPEPYRDTLQRHLVHGQQAAEIAAATGVPAGTVRMRLHRGLDQLRQRLPAGFAGGAVALVLTRESFAAMRRVVLHAVPGGAEVAAVAVAGAGHFMAVWLGVILMKKTMMSVLVAGVVLAGSLLWWQPFADAAPPAQATVTTNVRPLAAALPPPDAQAPATATGARREAAAPTNAAAQGQLRVVVRMAGDRQAIERLSLQVVAGLPGDPTPRDGRLPAGYPAEAFLAYGTTDADGTATFTVPPGTATVRTSLLAPSDAPWLAEVKPGQQTEMLVELPVLVHPDVEVVDADGRPIAGARILGRTIVDVGEVVERELGRTDAAGRWRDAFVERGVPVRAVHDGYVASRAVDLDARTPHARLVLTRGPATVTGTVFAMDGRPWPRAQVVLQSRAPGFAGERPFAVVADERGRFAVAHVPPGPVSVLAASPVGDVERRCARSDVTAIAGRETAADVHFTTGGRIVVALADAQGKPVVGQHVGAVLQPEPELWIYLAAMVRGNATTDARGIATLAGLLPGDYDVQTFLPSGAKQQRVRVTDQEVRVDWSLGATTFVEVRLVDDADRALADWIVTLRPTAGTQREVRSDADGVVRFADVTEPAGQLLVRSAASHIASLRTEAPTGRRTTLRVPANALPTAVLHGSVQGGGGIDSATVTAELMRLEDGRDAGATTQVLTAAATFRFAHLPAGTYLLGFRRGDREYLGAPQQFVLAPAATVDAGTVALQPPGNLTVVVHAADGGRVTAPWLGLALPTAPRDFGVAPHEVADATCTVQGLPAGSYEMLVWGEDVAPTFVPLTLTATPAPLPVTAARGTPTRFDFGGDAMRSSPMVTLHRDGQQLLRVRGRPGTPTLGLSPGTYRIDVECNGARGSAEFTVGAQPGSVEVSMGR